MGGEGDGGPAEIPEWWRGYRPTDASPEWSPPSQVMFSGVVDGIDLSPVPLNEDLLRDVAFGHAEVRDVEFTLDELHLMAYWSTFEDCVFRQRSKRLHPEGREPHGQLAWRPTLYRRCRFISVRLRSRNGFSMHGARFEECVFERCKWNINLNDVDMLRCRVVGPVASVVFFGYTDTGPKGRRRYNVIEDNDFTEAVFSNNVGFRYEFPIEAQRWPVGFTPKPDKPLPDDILDWSTPRAARAESSKAAEATGADPQEVDSPSVEIVTPAPVGAEPGPGRSTVLAGTVPRSMVIAVDTLDLPVKGSGRGGYGSALCALGDGSVATTWIEGMQAVRLARLDPVTGQSRVLKGARGELRDVVADPQGERAWLLMSHGLHEVSLDPFTIRRTLGKPLGTYQHTALRLDDDVILITRETGRVAQLVSTATMAVIGRIHVAAPQLALPTTNGTQVFGFGSGQVRTLTPDHRPSGKPRALPLGRDPVATSRGLAFLPALAGRRFNELDVPSDVVGPVTRASPIGSVAFLDPLTLAVDQTAPDLGIGSLYGTDNVGRLIASDHGHDPEPGSRLAVLDPTAHHVEGIVTLPAQLDQIAPIPDIGAVIRPFDSARTAKTLWVARWEQATTPEHIPNTVT